MQRSRQESGRLAERLVAELLEDRGFIVLGRNVRLGHLEIDIVALEGDCVVMVEVRARGRGAYERPFASLASSKKRMHLLNAADRLWRQRFAHVPQVKRFRIDVASVQLEFEPPRIRYVEGALMA